MESKAVWDSAYELGDTTRSWYEAEPTLSMRMLDAAGITPADSVIDVGGGASALVDALLGRGYADLTVLDISEIGLDIARQRLGAAAEQVQWLVVDLLDWRPTRTYDVWHDRAVLHFLTTDRTRGSYLRALEAATGLSAVAVFATFAPDGPQQCSGLQVARYSADDLAAVLGGRWRLISEDREQHTTPGGGVQPFTWTAFRRRS